MADDADAYTIEEFCQRHRMSRAGYYKLRNQGRTPVEMRLGSKVLISREAAAEWRRRIEAETPTAAA
jgi:predicted DNA-binding transcriptional regulator AlpA